MNNITKELLEQGPFAFPFVLGEETMCSGMTLRDYFAAKIAAAQSVSTSADTTYMRPDYAYPDGSETVAQVISRNAYAIADAMLAERAK